ncbi:RmlC-like cupin domain-containing protein [Dactylonectria macrodidyma]|uniref:RmlC-like cupin domain-containing protein n=1 Tax=Dactylonectria macrodidyma TaxID=307937 RepID=A0A9P9FPU0_9HYPO|nr:RmlC-like cupin domain-containing protein [Dactylonectria macrodidyma]
MASLIPFIHEILPMIMPSATRITRAKQLEPAHPTVEGPVIHREAIVNKCDKMCASVLTTRPKATSTIRHNSEQDAIVYAVSGNGILTVNQGLGMELKDHELSPGDFAFIPAWTEHQVRNETEEDVVWLMIQSGPHPIGADLADWGGDMVTVRN